MLPALYTLTQGTYESSVFHKVVDKLCSGHKEIEEAKIHKKDIGQLSCRGFTNCLGF